MGPPYAACTKAAALACLRHLSHDKHGAGLLAMQLTAAAPPASSTAADTPGPAGQTPREQQQQQELVKSGGTSCGANMVQQVLADLQALGVASYTNSANEGISAAGTDSGTAAAAPAADPQSLQLPNLEAGLLDDAASFVEGLVASLDQQQLKELPLIATLQVCLKLAHRGYQCGPCALQATAECMHAKHDASMQCSHSLLRNTLERSSIGPSFAAHQKNGAS
jgi:hypothetical protein